MNIFKAKHIKRLNQQGSIVVSILIVSIFFVIISSSLIVLANANITRAKGRVLLLQAQYAAESGVDSAIAMLNSGNESYAGSGSDIQILANSRYKSTYSSSVTGSGKDRKITATGKVFIPANSLTPSFTRKIEVSAERSSSTGSSSIVSRNIVDIASGVKNLSAKGMYVNGFINMSKNTTNLIAENITVVDKNTSASNCSIGGTGNLVKPATFSTPGQTKTIINMGFNNCISPPGNTSNANFTVSANQTNLTKIQSTFIPWSQYMDNTYQNSIGGDCRDWTTGGSTRQIPSTGNTKKTHYPNSSANISTTSCGTNGNINLDDHTYVINDHVHVRANFCATSACAPIFNNPSTTMRFIFIEGTVNFDSIRTASNSGPIVLVVYGADPASKSGSCPYGGSAYLGQGSPGSYTSAPDLFILSTNGICLDKTKFGTNPALGGVSGKNIYVASSTGTPFDLALDPTFPTEQIQVDLAWRAVQYRRL